MRRRELRDEDRDHPLLAHEHPRRRERARGDRFAVPGRGYNSVIESEYNKIYNKLSKKYSGSELNQMVKQKLYSRGFNTDEIIEIMQKKSED